MPSGCSIRALWILNNQNIVIFSRKFPVVEKRWRVACEKESDDTLKYNSLPYESELAAAFTDRKKREGSARGFGLRLSQSVKGSDSWVDDPITRHVISLQINKEEKSSNHHLLWPLILHIKGAFSILVLPLVEPHHLKSYSRMCNTSDCGIAVGVEDEDLSSLLLDLPSITGSFLVAHAIGDVITGEYVEPEVVVASSPSVGGLLDSLTGSIGISGISARAKPAGPAPGAGSTSSGTGASGGAVVSDVGSRTLDKEVIRSFISSAMPFGTPLDLNHSNISAIKSTGFSSSDHPPPADRKQPAWKPYLYKGKQKIMFTIHEIIHAAMYDRDEIPDCLSISGQVNCRAELEGLPDVSFPFDSARINSLSFHPSAQIPDHNNKQIQSLTFSPPLGNFVLMRYQAISKITPPIKGFYQLSMVSENEGAFLFKLSLMEGYKSPLTVEFCTVSMPFSRRKVVGFEGTPSVGTVMNTDYSVEWKILTNARVGAGGKGIEASFSGTVKFAPWQGQKGNLGEDESDFETESSGGCVVNVEDYVMEKMNKELQAVDLEEPFCWHAYNYAKVSFKMIGPSLSGMSIDPKAVSIFPSVKAPVEISTQVTSGDYILWNTLGKCPVAATPKS